MLYAYTYKHFSFLFSLDLPLLEDIPSFIFRLYTKVIIETNIGFGG